MIGMIGTTIVFSLIYSVQAIIVHDASIDAANVTGDPYRGTKLSVKLPLTYREPPISRTARYFTDLVENSDVFIDKTLLIKELFERNTFVTVITCPKKWGKSVILSMLRNFFELLVDHRGQPFSVNENPFRSFFTNGEIVWNNKTERLAEPPLISKHPIIIERYQGRYPVVYLDLQSAGGTNFVSIIEKIRTLISKLFRDHEYMMNILKEKSVNIRTPPDRKARYIHDLNMFENYTYTNAVSFKVMDLTLSLKFLTRVLWEHFNKKVIVLIDDYDVAYMSMLMNHNFEEKQAYRILKFFTDLLTTTFYGNGCLKKALLFGTFHVGGISSLIPRVAVHYDFVNNPFYKYFGLSHYDKFMLLKHFNLESEKKVIDIWYGGFEAGEKLDWKLSSPSSVIAYLHTQRAKIYFNELSNDFDFLAYLINVRPLRSTFEVLLNKEKRYLARDRLTFTKEGVYKLKTVVQNRNTHRIPQVVYDQTLAYLCALGYLAPNGYRPVKPQTPPPTEPEPLRFFIKIPNLEMMTEISQKLLDVYEKEYVNAIEAVRAFTQALSFYVVTENAPLDRIRDTFETLVEKAMIFSNFTTKPTFVREFTLGSILNFASLKMRSYYKFKTTVFSSSVKPRLTMRKDEYGLIVGIKSIFNDTADPMQTARDHITMYTHLRRIKLLAIEFHPNKTISFMEEKIYPKRVPSTADLAGQGLITTYVKTSFEEEYERNAQNVNQSLAR